MAKAKTAEAQAVHDVKLHQDAGKPGYAVKGCALCDVLVAEGYSHYGSTGRGRGLFEPKRDSGPMKGESESKERGPPETEVPAPAAAASVTIVEPSQADALQAAFEAAEAIKPGLAEKLAPLADVFLRELAAGKAAEAAEIAWRQAVVKELSDLKEGMAVLHNNIAVLYRMLSGEAIIRKVAP